MTGWKTICTMSLALVASLATAFGVVIPQDEQSAITGGVIAVIAIILRLLTKTPVGGSA